MKQYLLSVCYPAGSKPPASAALEKIMRDVVAVQQEMQAAGAWVFGGGLDTPAAAKVVVQSNGRKPATTDGPFIESKEVIGGITIVKAPDFDTALEWGRKLAVATTTPIEVRAFFSERAEPTETASPLP
jgi:hypothetical protein